ncbi:MAG: serine hydrolase [Candidatus Binatia bacterium]|nr:serine hydrolase [Candidatus Binatia bacterium]
MALVRCDVRWWCMAGLCALLVSCGAEPAAEPPATMSYVPSDPAGGEWARTTPAEAGLDEAVIESALEFAGARRSSGVVILHDGRIVAERYWDVAEPSSLYALFVTGRTTTRQAVEDVASVQKSVVSFLTGVAEGQGVLDLGAPVTTYLGARWQYNTAVYRRMLRVLEAASGLAVDDYTRLWLTDPIGMTDSGWTPRSASPQVPGTSPGSGF